jgi:uncharacterized membrane protein
MISLWDGVKAFTPDRLRCPHCRQRLRVKIRRFWLWAALATILQLALLAGCVVAYQFFGWTGLLVAMAGSLAVWLIVELLTGLLFYTWGQIVCVEEEAKGT